MTDQELIAQVNKTITEIMEEGISHDAIAELLTRFRAQEKWISVSDFTPKRLSKNEFLIYTDRGNTYTAWTGSDGVFDDYYLANDENITHYMPLPSPPTKQKVEKWVNPTSINEDFERAGIDISSREQEVEGKDWCIDYKNLDLYEQIDFHRWQKENTLNISASTLRYQGVLNGAGHCDNNPFAPVITYQDFLTIKEKK